MGKGVILAVALGSGVWVMVADSVGSSVGVSVVVGEMVFVGAGKLNVTRLVGCAVCESTGSHPVSNETASIKIAT